MAQDGGVPVAAGQLDGVQRLGEGTDLVYLYENRVGRAGFNPLLQKLHIGNEQVVTNQLDLVSKFFRQFFPVLPVALGATIFDADDGVTSAELHIKLNQLLAAQG